MIIFINGSIHSGKSTVAKLLAERLGNTAVVEIDALRDFIPQVPLEDSIPINLESAVAVIKVFAGRNMNVVVPYPLSRKNHEYLVEQLKPLAGQLRFITLAPRLEVVLGKRGERKLSDWERGRIKHHYASGITSPDFGEIVDNSDETPEATVEKVLNLIGTTHD